MFLTRSSSVALAAILLTACQSTGDSNQAELPVAGAVPSDDLIQPGEERFFKHLWQVTWGGENAEAYWSFDGTRLVMQSRRPKEGIDCDQIFTTSASGGGTEMVSTGKGVTTCAYFLPGDDQVVYASTHGAHDDCPAPPDRSEGYVWALHPEYDIWVTDLSDGSQRPLITGYGYDAEATVSPTGDRMVFTSTRSGDVELWTCNIDGSDQTMVTDVPGYDGGAFFSHDGKRLVFRTTAFTPGKEQAELADYRRLLKQNLVRPSKMEIYTCAADGTERQQITALGGANFAPFFTPDDSHIVFSTNHHDGGRPALNFDIFMIPASGGEAIQVTHFDAGRGKQFDSFPMFSPNGRYMAFASNRGDGESGETNVFIAEWIEQ
ncbi:MAG: TolB protein [Planctomycetota bacterium]|jgi:TolB protein